MVSPTGRLPFAPLACVALGGGDRSCFAAADSFPGVGVGADGVDHDGVVGDGWVYTTSLDGPCPR